MSVILTSEQQAAITSRGKTIVSASAGSGKTFVMIERLVSLILEGADIRRVLAVTFTNKAAAQMKERLRSALLKRIGEAEKEERARLKEQLSLLPTAEISTIHAFCSRLIRAYFYLVDIDPAFRIISPDDADGSFLSAKALDEAFEFFYESSSPEFERLLDVYFQKKDAKLRGIVREMHASIRGAADYRERLQQTGLENGFEEVCAYLAQELRARARFFADEAEDIGVYFAEHNNRGLAVCAEIIAAAKALLGAGDLFEMTALAETGPKISRMPPMTKLSPEESKKFNKLKNLSAGIKELYKELQRYAPRETELARYLDAQEIARGLSSLVLKYDEIHTRLKREENVLDYDDLEHYVLEILKNEEAQRAVSEKYDFVFVDEYQDVNSVQEKILSLVGGEDVFLVGDAKQSIYGFRGSRSEFFINKSREYEHSLLLRENFRSSNAVLEAVNRIFSKAMTEDYFGIDYRGALMRGGARYGEHEGKVSFHVLVKEEKSRRERGVYSILDEAPVPQDVQAEKIADLIEDEIGTEWFDADAGLKKQVTYGDIAVLVRKKTKDAEKVVAALSRRNIPVTTTAVVNVCDFWEARLLLDWFSYLDNAEQDIPLAGAMLSRIGNFTDGELAEIRKRFPAPFSFRAACREYESKLCDTISLKLKTFFLKTENYRALMRVRSAEEMGNLLLSDGLEAEIAAKKDGEVRLRRVRRLLGAEGDVNEFLRRMKASGYRLDYSESSGEDAVKVLTMHAAKGLEFPIVFLASLDAPFHGADVGDVLYTDRFLFAPKSYDLKNKIVSDTLLRRASTLYMERAERKEELNLFYVAMTRAKYRLYLLFQSAEDALSPRFAKRFSDFIDFEDCAQFFAAGSELSRPMREREALVYRPDEEIVKKIDAVYSKPYPFAESTALPVKSSATELLQEQRRLAEESERSLKASQSRDGASIEEGLAYHAFLEHVEFGRSGKEELARMAQEKLLTDEQLRLLSPEKLEKILRLPSLAALAGKRVLREQTFLVLLPAKEIFPTEMEDEIVLQGAIDLLTRDEEGYLILDYKYSSHREEELKNAYFRQIEIYRKAVARAERIAESAIRARIVNINLLFEINM